MRTLAVPLSLLLIVSLASVSAVRVSVGSPPALVSGVNLWRNYSAPSSDVQQFYTSNGTPVVSGGPYVFSPNPPSVNLPQLHSAPGGGNLVVLTIKLKGPVGTIKNFTYVFDLYTDAADKVHYVVNYTGGTGAMWLVSNKTSGFTPRDITGNASITSSSDNFRDQLVLTVNLSLIPSVTAWDVDAMAQERDSYYTYKKFIYQVPGHPGTAPAAVLGHVYVEGTNASLANVTLSSDVGNYTTLSNSTGAYILYMAPGSYNITAHKQGYQDVKWHVVLGLGSAITHDFKLAPQSFLDQLGVLTLLLIVAIVVGAALAALFFLLRRRRQGPGPKPPIGP
jgi:hypothetical protein